MSRDSQLATAEQSLSSGKLVLNRTIRRALLDAVLTFLNFLLLLYLPYFNRVASTCRIKLLSLLKLGQVNEKEKKSVMSHVSYRARKHLLTPSEEKSTILIVIPSDRFNTLQYFLGVVFKLTLPLPSSLKMTIQLATTSFV